MYLGDSLLVLCFFNVSEKNSIITNDSVNYDADTG